MVPTPPDLERQFEPGTSVRITRLGKILRQTKVDELPALFNVLRGEMSIVGPRPEVAKYVHNHLEDFKEILQMRPGLTDFASIKYRNEEHILASQPDPENYYRYVILPDKLSLAKRYAEQVSLETDLRIIKYTMKSIIRAYP
jgi:lipopolysaccharide/colanic/teichoic acid biosynthesis glycosyltransferase